LIFLLTGRDLTSFWIEIKGLFSAATFQWRRWIYRNESKGFDVTCKRLLREGKTVSVVADDNLVLTGMG